MNSDDLSSYVDVTGNFFSYAVLILWAPLALYVMRRWPGPKATAALVLAAILLLPEVIFFKPPGLPPFEKMGISVLWITAGALLFHRYRFRALGLTKGLKLAIAMLLIGSVLTILLNGDAFTVGPVFFAPHRPYDAVHYVIVNLFLCVLPFLLGAAMFRNASELRILLQTIVVAAIMYSLLQLIEIRFSPQPNVWVYGYHQHDFIQSVRGSGFRPMVFMTHGLAVAMFTTLSVVAAAALYKLNSKVIRIKAVWLIGYLWFILYVSKSLAAFLYSLVAVPLVLFASPKNQVRLAALLGALVFVYPVARGAGLVPVKTIETVLTERYGEERAQSLMTRLDSEKQMLKRARERLFFGWGSNGRAIVFDSWSGRAALRDGDWLIMIGDFGLVGFLGKFLILLLPVFLVWRRFDLITRAADQTLLVALSIMVAFSVIDLIPNGNFNYLVFICSGALFSAFVGCAREQAERSRQVAEKRARGLDKVPSGAG